ncbi:multidrug effflux MFS transporter [Saccharospirillum mangrovi]|uniref:multidrug effflux MFS transporter n=1 Tax=Saccharospirillum mangrovi TaxID=2161747 RepID=UPI000D3A1F17|nr:multidrug effflux MFS transporter [Saccharospirillum mangrovi]
MSDIALPAAPQRSLPELVAGFALLTCLTALSLDAILPSLYAIEREFSVTTTDTQLVVSMLVLGMAFGELSFGPVADAIGRKPAILIGLGLFLAGTLIALLSTSLPMLLAGRVIQGIGLGGPKIGTRALIRDQFSGDAMARIFSFVVMLVILVPMVAPAFGQLVLALGDWRAIFISYAVLALIGATWLLLRQPETLSAERRIPLSFRQLATNSGLIVRHKKVMAYTLTAGLIFGCQVTYLSTAQAIFDDIYQAGAKFALYFALLASGIGLAAFTNGRLVMKLGMHRQSITALSGMLLLSFLLLVLSWLGGGHTPLAVFLALGFGLFFCVGLLFGNINALAMEWLGRVAGLGASVIASLSSLVSVGVALLVGRFYDQTLYSLAMGFFVCAALALVLVVWAKRSSAVAV